MVGVPERVLGVHSGKHSYEWVIHLTLSWTASLVLRGLRPNGILEQYVCHYNRGLALPHITVTIRDVQKNKSFVKYSNSSSKSCPYVS